MKLQDYMAKHTTHGSGSLLRVFPRITCADGFSISIQGGVHAYCTPRTNHGHWTELEAGMPNFRPSDELMTYAEDSGSPTETVYPYVPIEILQAELDAHGGIREAI